MKKTINILGQKIIISYNGLSPKEIFEALKAPYDEKIMDEMIQSPLLEKESKNYPDLNFFRKRVVRGRLVVKGAYDIYVKYRDQFIQVSKDAHMSEKVR